MTSGCTTGKTGRILLLLAAFSAMLTLQVTAAEPAGRLQFRMKLLAVDSNEGCDIADVNNDGQLDVIAGRNWFAAPDHVPRPLRSIADFRGYVESNGDFARDVNGDGWIDVIAGSFFTSEVYWYENPGGQDLMMGKLWEKHLLVDTRALQNEGQLLHDLDGDGTPEWVVNSWAKVGPLLAWKFTIEEREVEEKRGRRTVKVKRTVPSLSRITIGTESNGHGLAFGDLNGDGREDLLFEAGWYERPAKNPLGQPWKLHPDWKVHASVPFIVRDLNADGRNDIIIGLGHDYGLWWWEQTPPAADGTLQWKKHEIDNSFSQPHCLHMADLDGDGVDELITGKRVYAHNGNDPGGKEPPCLRYYTWDRDRQKFTGHIIDQGRVGTGLQIRTADLNGDGRLDIAVAGKSGTFVLFNEGPAR